MGSESQLPSQKCETCGYSFRIGPCMFCAGMHEERENIAHLGVAALLSYYWRARKELRVNG